MCQLDSTIEAQIEQTVRQFLDEGRMFTGYDVTLETRTRESVQMRHKDVRGAIHELSCLVDAIEWGHTDAQGNDVKWKKSQIPMPGGWAFVYHAETADPSQYQPQAKPGLTPQQVSQQISQAQAQAVATQQPVTVAIQSPLTGNDSGGQNVDGTFSTDYRNRLFIRTEFLKSLGLEKGDPVTIVTDSDNQRVLLIKDYTSFVDAALSSPTVHVQQVEKNGDLRLSSKTLRSSGLDIAENFVIQNTEVVKQPVVEICQA